MSAPSTPPVTHTVPRAPAYYVGFLLFLGGMAMIAYVFMQANALLSAPPPPVPQVGTAPNAATQAGLALGNSALELVKKLLIMLVMCIAGSLFASRGIHMLFSAWNARTVPANPP